MAFIVLRRSRNTKSFYLVESYRNPEGKTCRRTLCYLGREQDGTDTLAKALNHWHKLKDQTKKDAARAAGPRKKLLLRRFDVALQRIAVLHQHLTLAQRKEEARIAREREREEAQHWQAIDRLRRDPSEDNARLAKQAFLRLAKRYHPDQGGRHQDFIRLKNTYDRALAVKRRHGR